MTEYVAISNTGKTITISFSSEFFDRWADHVPLDSRGRPHADVWFDADNNSVHITPNTTGRRVGRHTNGNGGAYLGVQSKVFPSWPAHGKVEFPTPTFDSNGQMILHLGEALPDPRPRNSSTTKVHHSRTDYSRDAKAVKTAKAPDWTKSPIPEKLEDAPTVLEVSPKIANNIFSNMLIELEGETFSFKAPLRLRLKILSLLQADPNVSGDAPIGFD